jgi:hypothetical protein
VPVRKRQLNPQLEACPEIGPICAIGLNTTTGAIAGTRVWKSKGQRAGIYRDVITVAIDAGL